DGLTYRFRLRADVSWSDGVPVTAADFAYTFRRMRAEAVASSELLEPIETAEASDDLTLEIRLRAPSNTFLYLLAAPYAFPLPKHRCEALGGGWREPANLGGNGPYVLSEVTDDHVILRARERWHGARGNVEEVSISLKPLGSRYADVWRGGGVDL